MHDCKSIIFIESKANNNLYYITNMYIKLQN